jgi:hypothetical protein
MSPARTFVTRGAAVAAMLLVGVAQVVAVSHAAPSNGEQQCDQMPWPLALPAVDGRGLDAIFNDPILICLSVHAATAPDGHNVMNDAANHPDSWRITSMTPPPGAVVPKSQSISLTVVPKD